MNTSSCVEAQNLVASALAPMLILDFILAIPGNILALWLIGFKAPWKPPNILFLNLALSDLLLLLALPFSIYSVFKGSWIFGDAFCRINLFMLSVHQSASLAFMSVLAVERYFLIVHPFHQVCKMSIRTTVKLACGVWGIVMTLRLPLLVTRLLRSSGNQSVCQNVDVWTESGIGMRVHSAFQVLEFVVSFILVLCSLIAIWEDVYPKKELRQHRRVKRSIFLLLTMIIICTVCYLPGYITGLMAVFLQDVSSCSPHAHVGQIFTLFLPLAFLNGALNPVLYTLSCRTFRDFLKARINSTGFTNFRLSVKERRPRRPKQVKLSFKKKANKEYGEIREPQSTSGK